MVEVIFDGNKIQLDEKLSVLDALNEVGIELPNFCHDERLDKNYGVCGLCTIMVNGKLQKACQTPVTAGLTLDSKHEDVIANRKTLLQKYIDDHNENCLVCPKTGECKLQKYCFENGVVKEKKRDIIPTDATNPFYYHEISKCVACGRCYQICANLQCNHAIHMASTDGFRHSSIDQSKCVSCGNCVSKCPVGSLMPKSKVKFRISDVKRVNTTCTYCGVGCQIELRNLDGTIVESMPRDIRPNAGLLCVKGKFGYSFVNHPDRLKTPLIRKDGKLVEATWDEAYALIAEKFGEIKQKFGPDSIGGFSSAKCTNEENYLFQKFMRVAIGTNNIDHCARFCHSTTGAGLGLSLGIGAMSNTIDEIIDNKIIFMTGSNARETHPVIGTMIKRAKQRGAKLIIADPRKIDMSEIADIYLPVKLGSNAALFTGMINIIINENLYDKDYVEKNCEGFAELQESSKKYTPEYVGPLCGIAPDDIRKAARLYASGRAAIYFTMGTTQHTNGTYEVQEIATLALLCGNLGQLHGGVNPLRGQNNVQGAGDMGAHPNKYPGGGKVDNPKVREHFEKGWNCKLDEKIGMFSTEMMKNVETGSIKALYIMGENPALSDPDLNNVHRYLKDVDFLVVQDIFLNETGEYADVVLPASSFVEKDGTFTNTERKIQRVRKVIDSIADSKPDWKILTELFEKMGVPQDYKTPEDITREIGRLVTNYAGLNFDLIERDGIRWPIIDGKGTEFLYSTEIKRGKGLLFESSVLISGESEDKEYPYDLTTGRVLYQFHTRTMTGRVPGLNEEAPSSYIGINPADAANLGIKDGDKVQVSSRRGQIETVAKIKDEVREGIMFMPFHFADGEPNYLTDDSKLDPIAKMPEFKTTAIAIKKLS